MNKKFIIALVLCSLFAGIALAQGDETVTCKSKEERLAAKCGSVANMHPMVIIGSTIAPGGESAMCFNISAQDAALYRDLKVRFDGRVDNATAVIQMTFNDSAALEYATVWSQVNNGALAVTTTAVATAADSVMARVTGELVEPNASDFFEVDIFDAFGSLFKSWKADGMTYEDGAIASMVQSKATGTWANVAPINKVCFVPSVGNWSAGSRLTLYGIRN